MPYALSNLMDGKQPSFRAVADPSEATAEEVVVQEPPGPDEVWDEAAGELRVRTEDEELSDLKGQKVDLFAAKVVDELSSHFTGSHGDREAIYALAKMAATLFADKGWSVPEQVAAIVEKGDKAMVKKQEIAQADTPEELEGIEWSS